MKKQFNKLCNIMEKQSYESPQLEIIEVEIEKGFANSNPPVGGEGEDIPFG